MKKTLVLCIMLLGLVILLSACGAPEPEVEEPTATPIVTEKPTPFIPTAVPTYTPKPMQNVEWPADPEATLIAIDPINKPTPIPLEFKPYREYVSNTFNIQFEIPEYLGDPSTDATSITFMEPNNNVLSGIYPATFVISVNTYTNAQNKAAAEAALDQTIDNLRSRYESVEISSKADNPMLGETGVYVTFRLNETAEGSGEPIPMRGRVLAVAKDKKIYVVSFMSPESYYTNDYMKVFRQIRNTIKEL